MGLKTIAPFTSGISLSRCRVAPKAKMFRGTCKGSHIHKIGTSMKSQGKTCCNWLKVSPSWPKIPWCYNPQMSVSPFSRTVNTSGLSFLLTLCCLHLLLGFTGLAGGTMGWILQLENHSNHPSWTTKKFPNLCTKWMVGKKRWFLDYPITLKLTAIFAPKNGWLEYYFPIGEAYFQGRTS